MAYCDAVEIYMHTRRDFQIAALCVNRISLFLYTSRMRALICGRVKLFALHSVAKALCLSERSRREIKVATRPRKIEMFSVLLCCPRLQP